MCRKQSFRTRGRGLRPASAAVCRIPCLILCLAYVESVCRCRAPNSPCGWCLRRQGSTQERRFASLGGPWSRISAAARSQRRRQGAGLRSIPRRTRRGHPALIWPLYLLQEVPSRRVHACSHTDSQLGFATAEFVQDSDECLQVFRDLIAAERVDDLRVRKYDTEVPLQDIPKRAKDNLSWYER